MVKYGVLNPKNLAENEYLLGPRTLGIEVTIPELAKKCGAGNIDPQHTDDSKKAAIEAVYEKYKNGIGDFDTIVTIRPDIDSIGAMALLKIIKNYTERINLIAQVDSFQYGKWQPLDFPTKENLWPIGNEETAALSAAVSDHAIPIEKRVEWMARWLSFGEVPEEYKNRVVQERLNLIDALENGDISINVISNIAIVETTHRAATMLGYHKAPVVIAINPKFQFQGGNPHRKITICQYSDVYCDLKNVARELSAIEPSGASWGGSPTIIGSPQGKDCQISVDDILNVVKRNML